jgi:hypothetical protein
LSTKEALEQYTRASRDVAVFDDVYGDVMKTRALLQKSVDESLVALKEESRREGSEVANRYFEVKLTTKQRRSYDADELVRMFPKVLDLAGVITKAVDRELTDHYVEQGFIPLDVAKSAERIEPMTTAVSVKKKCGFGRVSAKVAAETKKKTGR